MKRGFTLTELLIVMMILGIMAALTLAALSGATELAREQRTRAIIGKIDQLVMERYEGYRTRAVPIRIPQTIVVGGQDTPVTPRMSAGFRLTALRDLMRMEMPERVTDAVDGPVVLYFIRAPDGSIVPYRMAQPSLHGKWQRLARRHCGNNWATVWTEQHQGSECLYLILSSMDDGDKNALDFFSEDEKGDTDGDGMKEILDGWGRPIEFLRWAPGYTIQAGTATTITTDAAIAPDYFDPMKVDPRWSSTQQPYALRPLIVSGGRDKQIDVAMKLVDSTGAQFRFVTSTPPNDPYYTPATTGQFPAGTPVDFDSDGISADNITNHWQETP